MRVLPYIKFHRNQSRGKMRNEMFKQIRVGPWVGYIFIACRFFFVQLVIADFYAKSYWPTWLIKLRRLMP